MPDAEYPTSAAKSCGVMASPVSTMISACVRRPVLSRWLCTAATASNDGMGTPPSPARSETTMMFAPPRTAASACWHSSAQERSSACGPPSAGYAASSRHEENPCRSIFASASNWAWSSSGVSSRIRRQLARASSRKLPWFPTCIFVEVMNDSRSASMGGFVTCANSWLK